MSIHRLGEPKSLFDDIVVIQRPGKKKLTEPKPQRSYIMSKDRISQLPVHLKQLILSHLPSHEAMVTTRLSPAWRDLWIGLPCLDLGENLFGGRVRRRLLKIYSDIDYYNYVKPELYKQYMEFVEQVLKKRCENNMIYVDRLNLYVPELTRTTKSSDIFKVIDRCMKFAIGELKVDELNLKNDMDNYDDEFKWGRAMENVTLSSLKGLSLNHIPLVNNIMELLAKSCPLIEKLCLAYCGEFNTYKIAGLQKLTQIKLIAVQYSTLVLVDLPNLTELRLKRFYDGGIEVIACGCLRRLKLSCEILQIDKFSDLLEKLEILSISHVYFVEASAVISSSNLKLLTIKSSAGKYVVEAPNLEYIKLAGMIPSQVVLAHSTSSLVKATYDYPALKWADVLDILRKFRFCEVVELLCHFDNRTQDIKTTIMEARTSPANGIQRLTIKYYDRIDKIVETLLQLCPRLLALSILSDTAGQRSGKDLQFTYYDGQGTKNRCLHCQNVLFRCWQHELKEVTIVNHRSVVKDESKDGVIHKEAVKDDTKLKALFSRARKRGRRRPILVNFGDSK